MALVETKFDIGQKVYIEKYGEIRVGSIQRATIVMEKDSIKIVYITCGLSDGLGTATAGGEQYVEEDMYYTKQEAVEAWLSKQNMTIGVQNV